MLRGANRPRLAPGGRLFAGSGCNAVLSCPSTTVISRPRSYCQSSIVPGPNENPGFRTVQTQCCSRSVRNHGVSDYSGTVILGWAKKAEHAISHQKVQTSELAWTFCYLLAEAEGFEPPERCRSTVFKTAAIDHSATPPVPPTPSGMAKLHKIHYSPKKRNTGTQ